MWRDFWHKSHSKQMILLWGFVRFVWQRFQATGITQVAGSLTFTTLLALVPLLAMMLSVVTAFPMFHEWSDAFMAFVNRTIVPSGASAIADYLNDFKQQTGKLTALGIGGMIVTSLLLLQTIDETFNRIWQVRQLRSFWVRFPIYWLLLTLGPLVVGLSLSVSATMQADIAPVWLSGDLRIVWQILYNTLFLSLLYRIVPNCKVPVYHALLGAFITALALALAKWGFGVYVRHANTYTLIYGAFAVVPVFLVWLHLLWMIVLSGALLTACMAYWHGRAYRLTAEVCPSWHDCLTALQLLAKAQQQGEILLLSDFWQRVSDAPLTLEWLAKWDFAIETRQGWTLKTVPQSIVLADVFIRTVRDDTGIVEILAQQLQGKTLQDVV